MDIIVKGFTTLLINKFDLPLSATSLVASQVTPIIHDSIMGEEDHDGKKLHIIGIEFVLLYAIRYGFQMDVSVWDTMLDVGVVSLVDELYKSQRGPQ